jgi:hypothetical protein
MSKIASCNMCALLYKIRDEQARAKELSSFGEARVRKRSGPSRGPSIGCTAAIRKRDALEFLGSTGEGAGREGAAAEASSAIRRGRGGGLPLARFEAAASCLIPRDTASAQNNVGILGHRRSISQVRVVTVKVDLSRIALCLPSTPSSKQRPSKENVQRREETR